MIPSNELDPSIPVIEEMTDRELIEAVFNEVRTLNERFDVVEMIAQGVAENVTPVMDALKSSPVAKMLGVKL